MPEFETEEHKKAWLIRVTINCTKNILGSSYERHRADLDENLKFETPEKSEVFYAVLKLPKKYRTVIHLYYYEDYSIKEISNILKTNENTVKSQLSRARAELEKMIKGMKKTKQPVEIQLQEESILQTASHSKISMNTKKKRK